MLHRLWGIAGGVALLVTASQAGATVANCDTGRGGHQSALDNYAQRSRDGGHHHPGPQLVLAASPFDLLATPTSQLNVLLERHHHP